MAKRLTDNINSQFFEAANRMTSKKARRKIVAYVESYDDVFFWRSVLGKFENEKRYFDIMLPTRNQHLDRGKKAAISSMLKGVGRDMIICVRAQPSLPSRCWRILTSSIPMPMPLKTSNVMPEDCTKPV